MLAGKPYLCVGDGYRRLLLKIGTAARDGSAHEEEHH
jgi:hypothetical protein